MSMNRAEIAIVVRGLAGAVGGFVQKVRQTAQGRLYLDVRVPGRSFRIFLCAESGRTRICLGDGKEEGPRSPLAFQGLLRSRLTGAQLKSIAQPSGDRCVRMEFDARGTPLALVAELTGRHGNLLLVSGDGTVLGCAFQGGSEVRGLKPGARYEPPPVPRELAAAAEKDAPRFPPDLSLEELSLRIEEAYRQREREEDASRERASRMAPLKARLKKAERALLAARRDLARTEKADEVKRTADLLKANMRLVRPGDRELSVTDYREDGIFQVVVKLDPALPPQEQVEAGYRKYRHLLSGREKAGQRVAALSAEVEALGRQLDALERGEDAGAEVPAAVTAGALPPPARQASRKLPKGSASPFREYVSSAGQRIWVGRNAALNDALTFKCARGNDVWFHARGVPGSHVVVPLDRGEAMAEATRLDALALARHFSNFRDDAGEVSWTLVKYVRRQKDGAPGAVVYSQERTVLVRPDTARLERLTSAMPARK